MNKARHLAAPADNNEEIRQNWTSSLSSHSQLINVTMGTLCVEHFQCGFLQ